MTYAGLKSMIYAGLTPDDERVKAAIGWLKKHYDLDNNPGLGDQGLYYYYQTFAKALSALGQDTFIDDKGVTHDWRKDLIVAPARQSRVIAGYLLDGVHRSVGLRHGAAAVARLCQEFRR